MQGFRGYLHADGYEGYHKLFAYERGFANLSPQQRQQERMQTSKPVMEAFFAWANSCNAIPKFPVGKAVYYAQSQRKYLERYLLDGRLEISNNRITS